ncbi:MAG: hypothetical protein Q9219_003042 [cf. Caloplaca sp. 3 TL-2023]
MSIENLKTFDPFAEADEDTGETKQSQNYIHIRIQQRNGRKTLTTVQGLPKKFDQKKILKVIKKKFGELNIHKSRLFAAASLLQRLIETIQACNGTIVNDTEMGEVIQLQGDQRKDVQEFLVDKKEGLALDSKTIKVAQHSISLNLVLVLLTYGLGSRLLAPTTQCLPNVPRRTNTIYLHKSGCSTRAGPVVTVEPAYEFLMASADTLGMVASPGQGED